MLKISKNKAISIIGIVLVFSYFLSILLSKETTNLDELWNYNIARNIANGLIPYKDISLITTPFLPMVEAGILKITVNELIVFRFLNAILITAIIYVTYKIFNTLGINKIISAIMLVPIVFILKDEIFLDYNFFILFITLIIMYIELKGIKKELSKKREIIIGILAGLAICTKQTIGILICLIVLAMPIILGVKKENKKNIFYRLIGVAISIFSTLLYLIITGAISDFFSYTVFAINTFSNTIPYSNLINSNNIEIRILAIILPIVFTATISLLAFREIKKLISKKINVEKQKIIIEEKVFINIKILLLYSIPLLAIQYPIADEIHFKLSNYIIIMIALFIIYTVIKRITEKLNNNIKKSVKISIEFFIISCSLVYLFLGIMNNTKLYFEANKNYELKYYKGLIVPEYIKELYNNIAMKEKEYENQGKSVNILDSNAVALHIPMDKYVKNYDMFNKGNFGKDGEEGIIKQIKEKNNQVYLVKKHQFQKNWQNPKLVTEYIENNLTKIDEVDIYDIYEK